VRPLYWRVRQAAVEASERKAARKATVGLEAHRASPKFTVEARLEHHDIVVIGGSAGAIEILLRMAEDLPEDLPAAVFIVQHVSERSVLPELLDRAGTLRATHARDQE